MTFKELLAIEHPDKIRPSVGGGCVGCPKDYGYERGWWCDILHPFTSCDICWNREMKGEKEMSKDFTQKTFWAAVDAVNKAEDTLREAKKKLKDLEQKIEDMNKKPMMHYKDGRSYEIVKYCICNGGTYVEFETSGYKYRYYTKKVLDGKVFPSLIPKFETYNIRTRSWDYAELIDHIELLEGVEDYDQT